MNEPIVALDARLVGKTATGDSTYWTGLLHGLSRIDHGLKFLLYSNDEMPEGIPESPHFTWVRLPSRRERWWSLFKFPLHARRNGAKVIHTQYNLSPLAGAIGVTTIHDVSFFIGPEWFRPVDRVLLQRLVPSSVRRSARVITVSETSKRDIEKYLPDAKGKTRVTHLALNTKITPMERAAAQLIVQDEMGLVAPFLLTVGTRWPRKNMRLAIDAVEKLDSEFPHKLAITGKAGWDEGESGERSFATGYVVDWQLSALYSAADIYLAPSKYEGFGLPLLEAFACGCPVICSTGGSLPEVAGNAALVLQDWTAEGWSKAISNLLCDSSKLESLRAAGYERVKDFSWEEMARKTCDVYREVIQ